VDSKEIFHDQCQTWQLKEVSDVAVHSLQSPCLTCIHLSKYSSFFPINKNFLEAKRSLNIQNIIRQMQTPTIIRSSNNKLPILSEEVCFFNISFRITMTNVSLTIVFSFISPILKMTQKQLDQSILMTCYQKLNSQVPFQIIFQDLSHDWVLHECSVLD